MHQNQIDIACSKYSDIGRESESKSRCHLNGFRRDLIQLTRTMNRDAGQAVIAQTPAFGVRTKTPCPPSSPLMKDKALTGNKTAFNAHISMTSTQ